MVSVGGREPTSVEEAVEGIRLGGRTVHILVSFAFSLKMSQLRIVYFLVFSELELLLSFSIEISPSQISGVQD